MFPASEQADSRRFSGKRNHRAGIDEIPPAEHLLQHRCRDRGSGRNGERRADGEATMEGVFLEDGGIEEIERKGYRSL